MGVFSWIREGVRRSVLLGFSDAVEQLGATADAEETVSPQLAAILREAAPRALNHSVETESTGKNPRKRLGRSLEQLRNPSGD